MSGSLEVVSGETTATVTAPVKPSRYLLIYCPLARYTATSAFTASFLPCAS